MDTHLHFKHGKPDIIGTLSDGRSPGNSVLFIVPKQIDAISKQWPPNFQPDNGPLAQKPFAQANTVKHEKPPFLLHRRYYSGRSGRYNCAKRADLSLLIVSRETHSEAAHVLWTGKVFTSDSVVRFCLDVGLRLRPEYRRLLRLVVFYNPGAWVHWGSNRKWWSSHLCPSTLAEFRSEVSGLEGLAISTVLHVDERMATTIGGLWHQGYWGDNIYARCVTSGAPGADANPGRYRRHRSSLPQQLPAGRVDTMFRPGKAKTSKATLDRRVIPGGSRSGRAYAL
ncbi:hypothetical protein DL769_003981 [Monosporascus sp. CRB-8-3]|nr:hypothetical protein DL769_003981 [Monosporascus sp. CRB-8-3]